ncbi:MAG: hypothetical protein RLZZ563_462 [Pseudomonadota bacterium]|jgi:uncharacterized membrane protein
MTEQDPHMTPSAPADAKAAAPKPAGRGLRVALAVSVALNLLILGLVAGAVLRDGGPHGRMVRDLDFGPFTEALTPEDRDALRRDFLRQAPDLRDMRRQMRDDFATLLEALRAEPFDVEALRGVVANQGDRMAARLELGQDLMLARIAAMTPAERAAFADRLERRLERGPQRD